MWKKYAVVLLLAAGLHVSGAVADEVELPGILINETLTKPGRDFYAAFASIWPSYDPDSTYTLVIHEKPSVKTGSQIIVKYAGRVVFQSFIANNEDRNKKLAQAAAQTVAQMAGSLRPEVQQVMQMLFPDPDMAPDEISL